MKQPHKVLATTACLLTLSCTAIPEEPTGNATQGAAASEMKSYVHTLSRSRFAIGESTSQKSELGFEKVVGNWGVFATFQKTGSVVALPNADSPARLRAALTSDPEVHNAAVKKYFVDAGLPAGEIDGVDVHTKASATGVGIETPSNWQLASYTSVIRRQYDGVPVVDSYAWAQLNDLAEVVTESVYWPEIPKAVLVAATAFKAQLDDPIARATFLAKVPEGGRLVIHHTPSTWHGSFSAAVAYDVGAFGKTSHYDVTGVGFSLPNE